MKNIGSDLYIRYEIIRQNLIYMRKEKLEHNAALQIFIPLDAASKLTAAFALRLQEDITYKIRREK